MAVLHDIPGVTHILVTAPLEVRIQRIAASQSIPLECAREQVLASDGFRHHFMKKYYRLRYDEPAMYDLVINTAHITPAAASNLVVQTLEAEISRPRQYSTS
jgi:cytidylate kinase